MLSRTGFLLKTTNYLLAWWSESAVTQEPNKQASTSTESKGSMAPAKGSMAPNTNPAALDLMGDLVGGSADFDPIQYLGYSFVRMRILTTFHHKTMVINVDKETGRILLEYIHGQTEWVEPNIVQEALLSHAANGMTVLTYGHSARSWTTKLKTTKSMSKIQWDNGDVTWEPLNSLRKDNPVTLAKYAHKKGITNECGWKWSRKINKRPKKLLHMLASTQAKRQLQEKQ